MNIPKQITVGGQVIAIEQVENIKTLLGECNLPQGLIKIADKYFCNNEEYEQSQTSKENTFWHELTHGILDTMGESELSENEKFVRSFSSFLCEAMRSAGCDFINAQ